MEADDALLFLTIGFLAVHELDAIRCHEWRLFPLTAPLSETNGERVFVWLHIPYFVFLAWIGASGASSGPAVALSVFAVLHAGLHVLYLRHPKNEFVSFRSWAFIIGAAGCGGLQLLALPGGFGAQFP